ncbi:MAG: MoaD/ThiS family protein [Treponema sp.]|jgi:MoaD family protein|nr:MoaD/ThiS family protein [Treponema sp.]
MAVSILVPAALRAYTERQAEIEVSGGTVGEAVADLAAKYPDIRKHLYKDDDNLRDFINVYIGDTNIKELEGLKTLLKDGDSVMLVPAIAGGLFTGGKLL